MRQKIIWTDINEREAPREQEIKIQKRLRLNKIWDSFNSSSRRREGIKLSKALEDKLKNIEEKAVKLFDNGELKDLD